MTCLCMHTADVLGAHAQKRMNLTKTVRKMPINADLERKGYYTHDDKPAEIKYDTDEQQVMLLLLWAPCGVPRSRLTGGMTTAAHSG